MRQTIIQLPPNRVRRNYRGGLMLDRLAGIDPAQDNDQPEEWIASTIRARNPGLPRREGEGLAQVEINGRRLPLQELFDQDPDFYLGHRHQAVLGNQLGFLAKLLDAAMRLHLQAHPSAAYAQTHLNSRWGKLETYYILDIRPGYEGYLWLGFQHPPAPQEWTRIVLEQDMPAMHACFEKIPVQKGQVWVIPGGMPHAIGEGLLVMEVMEPTDWVVRCEFERDGIVVPPAARFMGMDPKKSLEIFGFEALSADAVKARCQVPPRLLAADDTGRLELLIGPDQTDCFHIRRLQVPGPGPYRLHKNKILYVGVVARGAGTLAVEDQQVRVGPGTAFVLPAGVGSAKITPDAAGDLEILFCSPGYGLESLDNETIL